VAASFATVGLGSDTGNSIRGPSAHTALVGIRSTMGLTSRAGVLPLSYLADVAGPMARTVEDAVKVFQVVVGEDPEDPATARSHGRPIPNYSASLVRDGLKGARIGILRQAYERESTDPEIVQVFMRAVEDLKLAGATIVDPGAMTVPATSVARKDPARRDSKHDINRFFADRGDKISMKSLADVVVAPLPSGGQRLSRRRRDW
jgi:Asp-tRNA(Asn)/Glu-tRNA(Gln) amidotransferase A subunit family amidase